MSGQVFAYYDRSCSWLSTDKDLSYYINPWYRHFNKKKWQDLTSFIMSPNLTSLKDKITNSFTTDAGVRREIS
jgi:hypothetical protein